MSRVSRKPVKVPKNFNVMIEGQCIKVKGPKGQVEYTVPDRFSLVYTQDELTIQPKETEHLLKKEQRFLNTFAGTIRAQLNSLIAGLEHGFQKNLTLVGVGYRGQVQGSQVVLTVGFTQPRVLDIPQGITVKMPTQTDIVVEGMDKHLVGQVAANIRALRPVEPYKGKGVRYSDERVKLKEVRKKK